MAAQGSRIVAVQGIAAAAVSMAERRDKLGLDEPAILQRLRDQAQISWDPDPNLFRDAAAAVGRMPQPAHLTPNQLDTHRLVDAAMPDVQLNAMLTGREWLERLAAE